MANQLLDELRTSDSREIRVKFTLPNKLADDLEYVLQHVNSDKLFEKMATRLNISKLAKDLRKELEGDAHQITSESHDDTEDASVINVTQETYSQVSQKILP